MTDTLQPILTSSRAGSLFSLFCDAPTIAECKFIELHIGVICLEKIPNDKKHFLYKLLIARLRIKGFKLGELSSLFGISEVTIRNWAEVLKSGDSSRITKVFGLLSRNKITPEVECFIRLRYEELRDAGFRNFRKKIQQEVKDIFDLSISGESLRKCFRKIETPTSQEIELEPNSEQTHTDIENIPEIIDQIQVQERGVNQTEKPTDEKCLKTKQTCATPAGIPEEARNLTFVSDKLKSPPTMPLSNQKITSTPQRLHHLGLVLFYHHFMQLCKILPIEARLCLQMVATVLQGALNVQQNRNINFKSLAFFIGKCISNRQIIREELSLISDVELIRKLAIFNRTLTRRAESGFYYYDPHGKDYTGKHPLLKGWCGRLKQTTKVVYSDYIHDEDGHPLYMKHYDNFYDLRERIVLTLKDFKSTFPQPLSQGMTFVVDRGIFGIDAMDYFLTSNCDLITWEKGYKSSWKESVKTQNFTLSKTRNNSENQLISSIRCQEHIWSKDKRFRQILIRITDPFGKQTELSILCSKKGISAKKAVELMLNRWLQENDFCYLRQHYGIDYIDSYKTVNYSQLEDQLDDRMQQSRQFYKLKKDRAAIKSKHEKLLIRKHKTLQRLKEKNQRIYEKHHKQIAEFLDSLSDEPKHQAKINKKINSKNRSLKNLQDKHQEKYLLLEADYDQQIREYEETIRNLNEQVGDILKEESRVQKLIEEGYCMLDTRRKALMDMLRIIARNIFYSVIDDFKNVYNDLRDDHELLRSLTECSGEISHVQGQIIIDLWPKSEYTKTVNEKIEAFLRIMEVKLNENLDPENNRIIFKIPHI